MRSLFIIITCVASFTACNNPIIKKTELKIVHICPIDTIGEVQIVDAPQLNRLISAINKSTKEPIKFRADYRFEFIYRDTVITVLVKNKLFKINGLTYKSNYDLEDLMQTSMKQHDLSK